MVAEASSLRPGLRLGAGAGRQVRAVIAVGGEGLGGSSGERLTVGGRVAAVRVAAHGVAAFGMGVLIGHLLFPQLVTAAHDWRVLRAPAWPWIAAVAVAMVLSHIMGAVVVTGSTLQRLRPSTTLSLQFAVSFTNRLAPSGLGGMATTAWYLRRRGADRAEAAASIALASAAGFAVHLVATTAVVAIAAPHVLGRFRPPPYWPALAAAILALIGLGALACWRRGESALLTPIRAVVADMRHVLSCPRRALLLFGGSIGVTASYALALAASMHAFAVHIAATDVLVAFLGASAIAAGSPTPGGMGAAEAALIAVTSGLVGQTGRVVDAVLAYRLVTYWLPTVPGAIAFLHLRRRATL